MENVTVLTADGVEEVHPVLDNSPYYFCSEHRLDDQNIITLRAHVGAGDDGAARPGPADVLLGKLGKSRTVAIGLALRIHAGVKIMKRDKTRDRAHWNQTNNYFVLQLPQQPGQHDVRVQRQGARLLRLDTDDQPDGQWYMPDAEELHVFVAWTDPAIHQIDIRRQ